MDYYNLFSAIEIAPPGARFVRIQSTALEQKRWGFVLADLDHDFLYHLAIGSHVVVHDVSKRQRGPRALWQGLPWVGFALNRVWFRRNERAVILNGCDVTVYFEECLKCVSKATLRKLKRYREFLETDRIHLEGCRHGLPREYLEHTLSRRHHSLHIAAGGAGRSATY